MKDFPMIRSLKSAVISTIVIAVPLLALALTPLTGVYAALLTLLALPTACCLTAMTAGLAPTLVGAAAGIAAMYQVGGGMGAGLAAIYLLPLLGAFMVLVARRVPFWKSCGVMIGLHVVTLTAVYLILQNSTGGSLYSAAGDGVAAFLDSWELGDTMLYQAYTMGLLTLPDSLAGSMLVQVTGGYALAAAARADLLLSARAFIESMLASAVPSLLVSQSILGGVCSLLLPLRFGFIAHERRAFKAEQPVGDFPDLGMPPFQTWHLPRGIGWQVGAALLLGRVLSGLTNVSPSITLAGSLLYAGASALFIIQGAALVNFMQKAKGAKRFWRVAVPVFLMALSLLKFIGIMDQLVNIRGLRKPRQTKEDE